MFHINDLKPWLKKNSRRDFGGLMMVGGQYEKGGGPSNSSFSLLQMLCQTQAFHFGSSETIHFM